MFTENIDALFDTVQGFAVSATYKGAAINVIYDEAYFLADGEDVGIDSTKPAAICKAADVAGVKQGDSIAISGTGYRIQSPKPDGTGKTVVLQLERIV